MKYGVLLFRACARRRSPCGERGLKCVPAARRRAFRQSLPVRGAWVEITRDGTMRVSK